MSSEISESLMVKYYNNYRFMDQKAVRYIKRRTAKMTPSERFMWVEREIYNYFRRESIDYVNGKQIEISNEPEFIAEMMIDKDEDITGALID